MEEWKTYKISELIEEISMGPFGSDITVNNFIDSGIPVLNGSNLQGLKLNEDNFRFISQEKADSLGKANAHRGDVVITHRGTLGQIIYIPTDSKYDRYVISQSQFRIRLNENLVRSDFFVYFFHTVIGQHLILMNASQVGVPALARPTSTFKKIRITIPPIITQNQIMSVINPLSEKLELNRKINDNLEQQGQALFRVLYHPEYNKGLGYLNTVAYVNPSRSLKKGILARAIEMSDLSTTHSFPASWRMKEYNGGCKFINGDTIMARITPCLENGKASYINCLSDNEVAFGSTEYIILSAKENLPSELLYFLIRDNDFIKYAVSNMNGSSGRQRVSGDCIGNYLMPLPNELFLKEFSEIFTSIMAKIKFNSEESIRLSSMRDSLLPKLMSGEIKMKSYEG